MTPQSVERPISMTDDERAIERLFWKWWNNERRPDENEASAFHAGYEAAATRIEDLRQQVERLTEERDEARNRVERLVNCEAVSILRGRDVVVTFKDRAAAFDLFNELEARAALTEKHQHDR